MDRLIGANVLATSGRAVEAAGDVDVLLLDKTGTITLGNREAVNFIPAPGITERRLAEAAQLASLADETPEGRSIAVLAKERFGIRGRDLGKISANFVPFSAETRMSGVDAGGKKIRKGADVVVGCVETHGRAETAALMDGLAVLPRREVIHRGTPLFEFDIDLALARRPQVLLLDELAHTNAPQSRHPKRWQDVLELLDAGIEVHTTVNIQHLDSLNDVVAQITGVKVRETVPDHVLDRADAIEIIDLTPDELLVRLKEGKVYLPETAQRAAENFFKRGNLLALRELALRRAAERLDTDVREYRTRHGVTATWPTAERILVCVGASPSSERVLRGGKAHGRRASRPFYRHIRRRPGRLSFKRG